MSIISFMGALSSMDISIITICLNAESTIQFTMNSVNCQLDMPKVEHIFVDGMSKDSTLGIIKEYAGSVPCQVLWVSEEDDGISDAFNKGLSMASGRYVLYLNADDKLFDQYVLRDVWAWVKKNNYPQWVVGDIASIDSNENIVLHERKKAPSCRWLKYRNQVPHPAVFLNRNLLLKMKGFDKEYKIAMDYHLWIMLCRSGIQISYFPRVISIFYLGGISSRGLELHEKEVKRLKALARQGLYSKILGYCYDRLKRKT